MSDRPTGPPPTPPPMGLPPDPPHSAKAEPAPERRTDPAASGPPAGGEAYPGEKARQGHIVLRSRGRRMVFIGGLVGLAIVGLLLRFCAGA